MDDFALRDSNVHGKGIFTVKSIEKNTMLFNTHLRTSVPTVNVTWYDGYRHYNDTPEWVNLSPNYLYNHSKDDANCVSVTSGDLKVLVTIREIQEGEEILVDYSKDKDLEQPQADWIV